MWQDIKNSYHLAQAFLAALFYNFPSKSLTVIGVTGTDGKTTTVNMIYHILKSAGEKVSMISTVNAQIGPKTYSTGFHVTTPDPWQVQRFIRQAVQAGSKYFVLEATSHGLHQNRLAFIKFHTAVVTNITHEHLDYHKTWENYAKAKARLFRTVSNSILNLDDQSHTFLKGQAEGKILTYSLKKNADFNLKKYSVKLKIPGSYNLSNALAALAACQSQGINIRTILSALSRFRGVSGRMEKIDLGQNFTVYIDFAHTPNGLEQALKTIKSTVTPPLAKGGVNRQLSTVICVFGAAGERDKAKRPLMGKIADQYADIIILTAEDPRSENPGDICSQIKTGIKNKRMGKSLFIIPDRKTAIEKAVSMAKAGDIVATFGKGHEKSMTFGNKDLPWDEFSVVKEAIQNNEK